MKNRFKKTLIIIALALLGTACFAEQPGQKPLGKIKSNEFVVTQEYDSVFTAWLNSQDWTKYLTKETDPTVPAWAKVENPPYLTSYTEKDPFFTSWLGQGELTFSNNTIRFLPNTSNFYVGGYNLQWWLEQSVVPLTTEFRAYKTEMANELSRLGMKDTETANNLADLSSRFNTFNSQTVNDITLLQAADSRLGNSIININQRLDDMRLNVLGFQTSIDLLNQNFTTLKTQTSDDITRIKTSQDELKAKVDNALASIETVEIDSLSNRVVSIETGLTATSNKTTQVESRLNGVSSKVDEIYGDYVKLSDLQEGIKFNTMEVTNLTVNGKQVALKDHTHTNLENAIAGKLDSLYGIAYGELRVKPEVAKIGSGTTVITPEGVKIYSPSSSDGVEYKEDEITHDGETYGFDSTSNGIARLKDVDFAITNFVTANGKAYLPMGKWIGGEIGWNYFGIGDGIRLWQIGEHSGAFLIGSQVYEIDDITGERLSEEPIDRLMFQSDWGIQTYLGLGQTGPDTDLRFGVLPDADWETGNPRIGLFTYNFTTDEAVSNNETVAWASDVTSATNSMYQTISQEFVKLAELQEGIKFNTMEVTNLTVNGTPVAVKTDVTSATNKLYGTIATEFVRLADLQEGIKFNTMEVTNLTINGKQVAVKDDINSATNALRSALTNEFVRLADLQEGIVFDNMDVTNITINGKAVAVKTDVSNSTNALYQTIEEKFVKLADLQDGIEFDNMDVTNLTVNGKQVSLKGHTHELWEIPGAEAAANRAIREIDAAQDLDGVKNAMKNFLMNFKKPE